MVRIHLTAVAGVGESFCPNQHLSAATIRKADQVAQKPPYCYERFRFAELATASSCDVKDSPASTWLCTAQDSAPA
jgi:hypothetical protein